VSINYFERETELFVALLCVDGARRDDLFLPELYRAICMEALLYVNVRHSTIGNLCVAILARNVDADEMIGASTWSDHRRAINSRLYGMY